MNPIPSLTLTLSSFAIILLLSRLKLPLWAAITAGAVSLGACFGLDLSGIARAFVAAVTNSTSLGLLLVMALLMALSEAMRQTGRLEKIVELVNAIVRRPAITLAVLPALIGLLPMPGGALFSAPMVRQAAGDNPPDKNILASMNYWWRHIWEHWWPLYPGVILAMSLTNSGLVDFAAFQMPLGIGMVLCGLLILRRLHADMHRSRPVPPPGTMSKLLSAMAPILCILTVWFVADFAIKTGIRILPHMFHSLAPGLQTFITKFAPILLGLLASLSMTFGANPLPARRTARCFLTKETLPMLGLVLSVMIYQQMLVDVKAAALIGKELTSMHVPIVSVVIILPFIAGMLTGVAFGFVGVSFPLVLSLVAGIPDHPAIRPYVVLAYASGHLGMMLSPIHLCYVVSNRYFEASFRATTRHIAWPCALMAALAAVYFMILRWAL